MGDGRAKPSACQTCFNLIHPALHVSNIKNLIPIILDTEIKQSYSSWSTLFRVTARAYNVLDHIDPTISTPSNIDATLWAQLDAVVLSWIYATVSTDLLVTILDETSTTAMDVWSRLRDMSIVQQQNKAAGCKYYTRQRKRNNTGNPNDDFISCLPDDVLVHILSLVGVKAAAKTSLVSKRWRHVWTHVNDLDFYDPPTYTLLTSCNCKQLNNDCSHILSHYVKWVNQVIAANQSTYLNTFRIVSLFKKEHDSDVSKWVEFAFTRKVRNLVLDLKCILSGGSSSNIHMVRPPSVVNSTLESLYLKGVYISEPFLQWVLSNCHNLQRLSLLLCKITTPDDKACKNKKLVISSLSLKHLEVINSSDLLNAKSLHIVAPKLTSFVCSAEYGSINVEYVSVPSLVDASFGQLYFLNIFRNENIFLSGVSSQLEKLSLQWLLVRSATNGERIPTFENIKQLELYYSNSDHNEITTGLVASAFSLIEACPVLHTFKLKLVGPSRNNTFNSDHYEKSVEILVATNSDTLKNTTIPVPQHLEAVEFAGYGGHLGAARLALTLNRYAPMLNKFIFDPRRPPQYIWEPRYLVYDKEDGKIENARRCAEKLAKKLKPSVEVVIL